ncbi:Sad1-interacting factor 2 [Ceratobasidium sp. AG-Ba]|nr:Sad1-interacting factor 2 [Ceratobasidium sp. AG-Ba]
MSNRPTLPVTAADTRTSQDVTKPRGANRSTKVAHKLKVLPEQPDPATQSRIGSEEDEDDDEEGPHVARVSDGDAEGDEDEAEVYKQIAQIPAGTARKDARRLTKKEKSKLPRVTAYCTAQSYKMDDLMKFFMARKAAYHTAPQLFDEVLYTPYSYDSKPQSEHPRSKSTNTSGDLLGVPELAPAHDETSPELYTPHVDVTSSPEIYEPRHGGAKYTPDKPWVEDVTQPEVFLFAYGTVVLWGMTEAQERRFLSSLKRFEVEKLAPDDVEKEDLNYYYANYSRIYNDVITLRRGSSYMTKLSLSHALAQSVKISLFEELIASTIEQTKDIPEALSEAGKIGMPHGEIMRQIGQLFLLRMNINLVGNVLDAPVRYDFPDLKPMYEAARSYLELPQRIDLLNARVEVLQDMLKLLKESVTSRHGERLEQIVIVLIGIEILLGVITIVVDLFSTG